jgi:hypothetical protein
MMTPASTAEVNDKYLGEIANVSENIHSVSQLLGEVFDFFKNLVRNIPRDFLLLLPETSCFEEGLKYIRLETT